MSTPIHQLPSNTSNVPVSEDDPFITGVIQEMESECKKQQPAVSSAPPQYPTHPAPQIYHNTPVPIATPINTSKSSSSWYNETFAKRAAIVAVIAFLMFYPNDLSPLYEKAPMLSKVAAYDRIIRMILLAVVLYVLFWKLNL